MRCAMMTELVARSPFQKSGTLTVRLIIDIFGGGAFFGALSGVGSLAKIKMSYSPAGTVNEREMRITPCSRVSPPGLSVVVAVVLLVLPKVVVVAVVVADG